MAVVKQKLTAKWYLVHDGTDILTQSDSVYTGELSFNDATHTCEEYATEALMDTRVLDFPLVSTTLNDGLISHWDFNDDSLDSVGSHNATLINSPPYVVGPLDKALNLDGSTQRAQIPAHTDFDRITNDFMWTGVFKFSDVEAGGHIISRWSASNVESQFGMYVSGSTLRLLVKETDGTSNVVSATGFGTLSNNVPYLFGAYKVGQNIGLRINDSAKETEINMDADMYVGSTASTNIGLGAAPYGASFCDLDLAFISYYNRELTDAEFLELWNSGNFKGHPYT